MNGKKYREILEDNLLPRLTHSNWNADGPSSKTWSQAYGEWNQGMVSEQEDKRFAMAKSIPGHESDREFMEGIEIKCSEETS